MKKLQNYIVKPQLAKRKTDKPSFRHDFVEWSKSNLHISRESLNSLTKHNRSRSPSENNKNLQSNLKKQYASSQSKQNLRYVNNTKVTQINKKRSNSNSKMDQQTQGIKYLTASNYNKGNNFNPAGKRSTNHKSVDARLNAYSSINHKHSRSTASIDDFMKKQRGNVSAITPKPRIRSAETSVNQLFQQKDKEKYKFSLKFAYSYRTRQGVLATNPKKTNQDSLLIKTKLLNRNIHLFAVADGHGTYGHLVSQAIAKNMSRLTEQYLGQNKNAHQVLPKVYNDIQTIISTTDINATCSGSTLVSVLIEENNLTCANVGDSRAILARQIDKKSWEMIYLSQDHKPSLQNERKRILKNGGRVHAFKDQKGNSVGPLRVWLPNQNIQGLAMTRSIGDNISKSVGVIHTPQIIQIGLQKRDKFMLIASDGIWQFISNQQVLQLIVPYFRQNKLQQACDALLKLAYERWTVEDTSVIDDITFVLIFLNQ